MEALPSVESLLPQLGPLAALLGDGPVRVGGYGDSPALSEELLALIATGPKRAGTGLLWAHEHDAEPLPVEGELEIVVDHLGRPALITRIVRVEVLPFDEVGAGYAAIEGEGDGSLAFWRQAHWAFFSRECRRIGREPSPTMPVVCGVFELLVVVPREALA